MSTSPSPFRSASSSLLDHSAVSPSVAAVASFQRFVGKPACTGASGAGLFATGGDENDQTSYDSYVSHSDVPRVPWKLRKPPRRSLILPHAA